VDLTAATLLTMFVVALVPLAPTEPVLTGMGVLAATEGFSPLSLIAVAALGCTLSDHLLYLLGRLGGGRLLDRLRRRPSVAAAAGWLDGHAERWGVPILIVGRWIPGGGTVGSVLAGTMRWKLSRFTPTSITGSTLWSAYVVLLGYLGGSIIGQPIVGIAVSIGVAVLVGLAAKLLLRTDARKPATLALTAGTDRSEPGEAAPVPGPLH
jgi:membrane protein DedA with SNARE-associated domain